MAHAKARSREKRPFKVIATAAMRKLLVILNQLSKTNTAWNQDLAVNFA